MADETYDPSDHTVDEVVEYAAEHPDEIEAIIEAERAGKNRTTLLSALEEPDEGEDEDEDTGEDTDETGEDTDEDADDAEEAGDNPLTPGVMSSSFAGPSSADLNPAFADR